MFTSLCIHQGPQDSPPSALVPHLSRDRLCSYRFGGAVFGSEGGIVLSTALEGV